MVVLKAVPYIHVSDLTQSLDFYQEALGYEITEELEEDGSTFWAELTNGDSTVMLSSRPVHSHSRLTWLYVSDADAAWRELEARGFAAITPPADQEHGTREFLATDPGGNVYVIAHELAEAATLPGDDPA